MADVSVFEYVVILQQKVDKDGNVSEPGKIIVEPTTVLATDGDQAAMLAARAIPDEYMDQISRISVACRPF